MSRRFDGVDDSLLDDSAGFDYPFSVAIWVKPDVVNVTQTVWAYGDKDAAHWHWLGIWNDGKPRYRENGTWAGSKWPEVLSTVAIPAGQWAHLVVVSASGTDRRLYVNGTKYTNTEGVTVANEDRMTFGRLWSSGSPLYPYDGLIGRAPTLWTVALTDADVATLYAGAEPSTHRTADQTSHWVLNGTASPEPDSVGSRHLTVNGATAGDDEPPIGATSAVGRSLSTTWSARSVVARSLATTWNVTTPEVGRSLSTYWHVAEQGGWHVLQLVGRSLSTVWNVEPQTSTGTVGNNLPLLWHVRARAFQSRSTTWHVRRVVGVSLNSKWHIRGAVARTLNTLWDVAAPTVRRVVRLYRVLIKKMGALRAPGAAGSDVVATIDDAHNVGASVYMNAPGEFHMTLPTHHPQISAIEPWQTHYAVERYTDDGWVEMFAGLMTDYDATENEVVFYGRDYLALYDLVVDNRYDPANPDKAHTDGGSKYIDQYTGTIIEDQVTYAAGKANSPVGWLTTKVASWPVVEKMTLYTTYASVLSTLQGIIQSHQQGTGNRPRVWVHHNRATDVYSINWYSNVGIDRPALRLEYGGMIQGFRVIPFGDFATTFHGIGRSQTGLKPFYSTQTAPGISETTYGLIERTTFIEGVTDQNDLHRRVRQQAAAASRVGKQAALGIRVGGMEPLANYELGDNIPVVIKHGAVDTTRYGSGLWTIRGTEWKLTGDANSEVTLVLAPKEDASAANPDLIPSAEVV